MKWSLQKHERLVMKINLGAYTGIPAGFIFMWYALRDIIAGIFILSIGRKPYGHVSKLITKYLFI